MKNRIKEQLRHKLREIIVHFIVFLRHNFALLSKKNVDILKDLTELRNNKGNVNKSCNSMHAEKLKDMLVVNTITSHLEQMFYELKDDPDLWSEWEPYFNTYLGNELFRQSWEQNQSQYKTSFRTYVNSRLD